MSRHDHRVSLRQMLDYACEAITMSESHKREDLDIDKKLRYALLIWLNSLEKLRTVSH